MIVVVVVYLVLKNALSKSHQDPMRRGTYENIYYQFSLEHPEMWSRNGPRNYVKPQGPLSSLKWRLISYWFAPGRTINAKPLADIHDLGIWARLKHSLARRWLGQIDLAPGSGALSAAEQGEAIILGGSPSDFGAVTELMALSTPVAMADADPRAAIQVGENSTMHRIMAKRSRSRSSSGGSPRGRLFGGRPGLTSSLRHSSPRPESTGSTGARVCEESIDDADGNGERRPRDVRRPRDDSPTTGGASMQLLSVPMVVARGGEHAP
jgi:hypothetical protein